MDREVVSTVALALLLCLAGCTVSGPSLGTTSATPSPPNQSSNASTVTDTPSSPRPTPECDSPDRPLADAEGGNVTAAPYPEGPPDFENQSDVASYIAAYEKAYRTNRLLAEHGSLDWLALGVGEPRFFDYSSESTIARLRYSYGYRIDSVITDSPRIYATYYVDDAVVVRAEYEGYMENEDQLKPDPLNDELPDRISRSRVVECFD